MTRTIVDTSALVALLYPDDGHNEAAATLLYDAAERSVLLVNPIVFAELAADPFFDTPKAIDASLEDTGIAVEPIPRSAGFDAGAAFEIRLERRGAGLQWRGCGRRTTSTCPECGANVEARQHVAADFLVGAQAELSGGLLTFDTEFHRDYFDVDCLSIRSA